MAEYKSVKVSTGRGGWGGPLTITPTDDKPLIYSVTGGGIHPVAAADRRADRRRRRSTASPARRRSTRSPSR